MHLGAWPLELGGWTHNSHTLTRRLLCHLLVFCVAYTSAPAFLGKFPFVCSCFRYACFPPIVCIATLNIHSLMSSNEVLPTAVWNIRVQGLMCTRTQYQLGIVGFRTACSSIALLLGSTLSCGTLALATYSCTPLALPLRHMLFWGPTTMPPVLLSPRQQRCAFVQSFGGYFPYSFMPPLQDCLSPCIGSRCLHVFLVCLRLGVLSSFHGGMLLPHWRSTYIETMVTAISWAFSAVTIRQQWVAMLGSIGLSMSISMAMLNMRQPVSYGAWHKFPGLDKPSRILTQGAGWLWCPSRGQYPRAVKNPLNPPPPPTAPFLNLALGVLSRISDFREHPPPPSLAFSLVT